MSILTDDDLKEMQEDWNPKHYGDINHPNYIANYEYRDIVASQAEKIWKLPFDEFKKRMEETEL